MIFERTDYGQDNWSRTATLKSILKTIKFPGIKLFLRYGAFDGIDNSTYFVTIYYDIMDSSFPHGLNQLKTSVPIPENSTKDDVVHIVWNKIKEMLIHDASEWFTVNGTIPFNPHMDQHHQEALQYESAMRRPEYQPLKPIVEHL